jgi:hypothetical protein
VDSKQTHKIKKWKKTQVQVQVQLHYTTATYGFQTNTHYEEMEEERIDEWIIGH